MALPKTIISATVGASLGRYKLNSVLGEGGMGRVFKARDTKKRRTVAIKVLNASHVGNEDMVKRFQREAKVIEEIDHENIVEVYELGQEKGHVFCVMEYLEGEPLEKALSRKRGLKLFRTMEILIAVAKAVEAAHDRGVVHRDLKPDNIFLLKKPTSAGVKVKVLDFGIAKLLDPKATKVTAQGFVVGTPLYMSLEQATGMEVDHRSDMYSFGVVAYRMLSGKLPHNFSSYGEMLAALNEKPPRLPGKTPQGDPIPDPLARLVTACLSKEPKERPDSFTEICAVLERVGASIKPARKPRRRRKKKRSVVGRVLKLAIAAGVIATGYVYREPLGEFAERYAPLAMEEGQQLMEELDQLRRRFAEPK